MHYLCLQGIFDPARCKNTPWSTYSDGKKDPSVGFIKLL